MYGKILSAVANLRKLCIGFAMSVCSHVSSKEMCFRASGIFSVWRTFLYGTQSLFISSPNKYKCRFDKFRIESDGDLGHSENPS
jgi:hypothetical protein